MLVLVMAFAFAAGDPVDTSPRGRFGSCMKGTIEKANAAKIAPTAYADFARQACAAELTNFRAHMIAYDLKAGWTRKKAEPDAEGQIGDAVADWIDRYRDYASMASPKPAAAK